MSPDTNFFRFFALGGMGHNYVTNFNFQRAISCELLDLESSFIYKNNALSLFYIINNIKNPMCISPNRGHHNMVRLGEGAGDTIRQILEGRGTLFSRTEYCSNIFTIFLLKYL